MFKKWRSRFFLIWTGQAFSLFGSALVKFALIWWLTLETGKATTLAIATTMSFLPVILVGPFAGVLADRVSRRIILIASDGLIALSTAILIIVFALGRESTMAIYLVMLVRATGDAFHMPTMQASTTMLVPKKHLVRVGSMNKMQFYFANFSAPPLAAAGAFFFVISRISIPSIRNIEDVPGADD
ncbi:MAG: MFS transporter [Spirochaetales bacterium]|jgi:MFS transporter, DHA3 family, macrolide efflux protein|nr:MFS transporter [Spirochaetales bacterium]